MVLNLSGTVDFSEMHETAAPDDYDILPLRALSSTNIRIVRLLHWNSPYPKGFLTLQFAVYNNGYFCSQLQHTPATTPIQLHHNLSITMPGITTFPPFPTDVPTHPLLIVDYQLLLKNDEDEVNKLWKAATELGFW